MTVRKVSFGDPKYAPIELPEGSQVALHLTVHNSPILFGCRTGLCGTCSALVDVESGSIEPRTEEELETLELAFDAGVPDNARLLCQLRLTADIRISARNS
jgi:ferredoxin